MMAAASFLLRRGRVFCFRCRFPTDLACRCGRVEVVRSLRTSDPRIARLRAATLAATIAQLWSAARMTPTEALGPLIDEWFRAALEREYLPLGSGAFAGEFLAPDTSPDERRAVSFELFGNAAESALDILKKQFDKQDYSAARPIARELTFKLGSPVDEAGRDFAAMCKTIMEKLGDIEGAKIRWARGEPEFLPTVAAVSGAESPPIGATTMPTPLSGTLTIAEAINGFIKSLSDAQPPPTAKQKGQYRSQLGVLESFFGAEKLLCAVTKQQAGDMFDVLSALPARASTHPDLIGLSISDASAKAQQLGLERMDRQTLNNYMSAIRALFGYQVPRGEAELNPFIGMQATIKKSHKVDHDFTAEEMDTIFSSPAFCGCRGATRPFGNGTVLLNDWRFWAPLIALFTGARVGEIAQLSTSNLLEKEGLWIFTFTDDDGKRLKTAASFRSVPVHDELIRLGLLRLHASRATHGHKSLLGVTIPKNGNAGAQPGNWFREKLLPQVFGQKRPRVGMHSFRHSFISGAREASIDKETRDRITGHQQQSVSSSYGKFPLAVLKQAIDKIAVPPAVLLIPPRT